MNKRLIQISKIVAVVVFAVGSSLFINAAITNQTRTPKSFVITYKVSRLETNSTPVVEEIRVQSVKATGEYKLLPTILHRVRCGTTLQPKILYMRSRMTPYNILVKRCHLS